MDNSLVPAAEEKTESGVLADLVWILKGFIYPIWSRDFYKEATRKGVLTAFLFLCLFAFVQTSINTISVAWNLSKFGREIQASYEKEEVPTIVIENGIATASGKGQFIYEQGRQIVAIDTVGQMDTIDTRFYSEGLLLTRTELHMVNEDGYQTIPLASLNETFGDPIILDSNKVLSLWSSFTGIASLAVLVGAFLWHSLIRFLYTAMVGLLVWGIVSIKNKGLDFRMILITGIYANIPTIYLVFIFKKIGFHFFTMHTIILTIIWFIVMRAVLKPDEDELQIESANGLSK